MQKLVAIYKALCGESTPSCMLWFSHLNAVIRGFGRMFRPQNFVASGKRLGGSVVIVVRELIQISVPCTDGFPKTREGFPKMLKTVSFDFCRLFFFCHSDSALMSSITTAAGVLLN